MAAKKAKRYTTVGGKTFAPGESIPADLVELIDNPRVWEDSDGSEEPDEPEGAAEEPAPAAKKS